MSNSNMNFTAQGSISFSEKPSVSQAGPSTAASGLESAIIKGLLDFVTKVVPFILFLILAFSLEKVGCKEEAALIKGQASKSVSGLPRLPEPPEIPNFEQYTILVGSFPNQEQANALAAKLRAAQINPSVKRQSGKWYVCVGTFYSRERAEHTKQEIRNRGFEDAIVLVPQK